MTRAFWFVSFSSMVACSSPSSSDDEAGKETGPCIDQQCLGADLVCLSDVCVDPDSTTGTADDDTFSPTSATTPESTGVAEEDSGSSDSVADSTGAPVPGDGVLDVLLVVDNSSGMADEQLELARAAVAWIGRLQEDAPGVDVQLMVTTTDFGNPLCTPFQPAGYSPAKGAPTVGGCNARIDDFTGLGGNPVVAEYACTEVCPVDVTASDPFVAFGPAGTNVEDDADEDVDGDGAADSGPARAAACLIPQGINGCGYESPLENMLQALAPTADWNDSDRPFIREGADLAIVIVTDEEDCSIEDYTIMEDPEYQATNPDTGQDAPSSAICWNAGIACDGPDGNGVYSNCEVKADGKLQVTSRYTDILADLYVGRGKRVDFFVIAGVPEVTAYDSEAPYGPTAGGLLDLVVREWEGGEYPGGDILPGEYAMGITAADKQFQLGVGPACTGVDRSGEANRQAVPGLRLFEVCQAFDQGDEQHCFIDSICAPTYDGPFGSLWGTLVR